MDDNSQNVMQMSADIALLEAVVGRLIQAVPESERASLLAFLSDFESFFAKMKDAHPVGLPRDDTTHHSHNAAKRVTDFVTRKIADIISNYPEGILPE